MLVDSVATKHLLDDELIPRLKDRVYDHALLDVPKTIVTAGNKQTTVNCNRHPLRHCR